MDQKTGGKAYLETCATGLVYNPNIQNRDLPSSHDCGKRAVKVRTGRSGGPEPTADASGCPSGVAFIPDPKDCNGYIYCLNGIPKNQFCNEGLHYNAKAKACQAPEDAGCQYPA
ncbi:uncharacterized protein LOC119102877 [Pollicipes pollicipes]|uniref:uncharacterized protein LOC119102877 n=1 Tax=Pollicipes pollicipes TaxID=41117 RepID=UPI001884B495|nr:uncharacterized protein LOC119102877 [Pollicipes pollicipes]